MRRSKQLVALGVVTAGVVGGTAGVFTADQGVRSPVHIALGLTSSEQPVYSGEQALVLAPTQPVFGEPLDTTQVNFYLDHYLDKSTPEVPAFTGDPANVHAFAIPDVFTQQSYLQGDADVLHELLTRYSTLSPTDPLYLFGYSQSATVLTAVDSHLNDPKWIDYVLDHSGPQYISAAYKGFLPATTDTSGGMTLAQTASPTPTNADGVAQVQSYAGDVTTYASEIAHLGSIAPDLRLVLVGDPAAAPGDNIPPGVDNASFAQPTLNSEGLTAPGPNNVTTNYGGGTILDTPGHPQDATVGTGYIGGTGANAPVPTDGYGMAGQNTNLDLSPTAVYTVDGDNWAQAQAQESCSWFIFCKEVPVTSSVQHMLYPGLDASAFTFQDHIGNVDYYNADLSIFSMAIALATAGLTYLPDPVDVAGSA